MMGVTNMKMPKVAGIPAILLGTFLVLATQSVETADAARMARSTGLTAAAASKVDPRLKMALAQPRHDDSYVTSAGRLLPIFGETAAELTFPVFIKTELNDAELAELGVARDVRVGNIVTARVSERDLNRVASHPEVAAVEAGYWLSPSLDRSIPETRADRVNQAGTGFTGEGVLYGLLDDGIDITHDDFKDSNGNTRIKFVWDHFGQGTPPSGFSYGVEYSQQQIDNGQASAFLNEGGHGSHVAGISVGDGSSSGAGYRGVAPDADIIAVVNGGCDLFCYGGGFGPFGQQTTVGSLDALTYFEQKASQLGQPLVINQSQGVTMGPHDGTTLFEQAYNQFIQNNDTIICVASGNDQEADWHSVANVSSGGSATFTANHETTQSGPLGEIFFELWWDTGRQFQIDITTPGGETANLDASTGGNVMLVTSSRQDSVIFATTQSHPANQQGNALLWLRNFSSGVEGGNWQVRVNSVSGSGPVHFYAERNQFQFKVNNASLDNIVAMPGSADEVITVGSYNTRFDWESIAGAINVPDTNPLSDISGFSSQGPRRDGGQKPDIAAPGQWIISTLSASHQTQQALIINDGQQHMALSGTSMAAPHVAGAIALMLEKDPTLTRTEVKQILQDTARRDGFTGGGTWDKAFGHGKLDVEAAVNAVEGGTKNCSNPGDANEDFSTNVLDVVATVNHVLAIQTLSAGGQACADLDGTSGVSIGDVAAIVSRILSSGLPRPALQAAAENPEAVEWGANRDGAGFTLLLDPGRVGAVEAVVGLPRGFELAGEPELQNAKAGVSLAWREHLGQIKVAAYDLKGRALGLGDLPLAVHLPVVATWDGGQSVEDMRVDHIRLSDPLGRKLVLAETPDLGEDAEGSIGALGMGAQAWPNPTAGLTQIRYQLQGSGPVDIDVYDTAGRLVRSLWEGHQLSGAHTLHWDGRNDQGLEVPDGVYFVQLSSDDAEESRKIHVVR